MGKGEIGMQKNEIAVYGKNNNYLSEYQGILDDFKEVHKLMAEANGPEVFFLITSAQKKLTKKSIDEIDKMITDLIVNFNDENIEKFMEKIISMMSSLETTKHLYGNIIDVDSIKGYISKKITVLSVKRYRIIESQIMKNRFIEESKLKVLYSNITNCKKIVKFAIDLDNNNLKAVEFIITMLNNLIKNAARMGVDNYTREVILLEVNEYEKILDHSMNTEDNEEQRYENEIKIEDKIVNEKAVEESCNMLVTLSQSNDSKAVQTEKLTQQFIDTSNEVVINARRNSGGGNYINEAVRQFASIMSTVQTLNYLQGGVIDIVAVAKNISTQLNDLAWQGYNLIDKSWDVSSKTDDDNKMYIRELNLYCDILLKSYDIYPDNIGPLKKYITILDSKVKHKSILKISKDDELDINRLRKEKAEIIKRKDPAYKLLEMEQKKKKGIFSRFWGH